MHLLLTLPNYDPDNCSAVMAHEIAKLLLEKADTFLSRQEAVKSAVELGMPLHEIEQYLDWLDLNRAPGALGSDSHCQRLRNEEDVSGRP